MSVLKKGLLFIGSIVGISIFFAGLLLILSNYYVMNSSSFSESQQFNWGPVYKQHNYKSDSPLPLLWKKRNVFSLRNSFGSSLCTNQDTIFMAGSLDNEAFPSMNALSIHTGELLWQTQIDYPSGIVCDDKNVYLGVGFTGTVIGIDGTTGSVNWKTRLYPQKAVAGITDDEAYIYIYTEPSKFYVLDKSNGRIADTVDTTSGDIIYFQENHKVYKRPLTNLFQAVDKQTNTVLWQTKVSEFKETPIFTTDIIYLKDEQGFINAIDRASGRKVWEEDHPIRQVNSLAYNVPDNYIYILTSQSKVIVYDRYSSEEVMSLNFSEAISSAVKYSPRSFYVNKQDNLLLVYFGDSYQLFVINLQ